MTIPLPGFPELYYIGGVGSWNMQVFQALGTSKWAFGTSCSGKCNAPNFLSKYPTRFPTSILEKQPGNGIPGPDPWWYGSLPGQ
jgi:hypothetical protein